MRNDIVRAVALLRNAQDADDLGVFKTLVAHGIESSIAARLVIFLPMVYCRLLLAKSGARFSERFKTVLPDGTTSVERLLVDEVPWNEAMDFAKSEIAGGIDGQAVLAVAQRSAEFSAVNQVVERGSKLEDIRFTASILRWPLTADNGDPG